MKTIIFILISIQCLGQNREFDHGLMKQRWIETNPGTFCLVESIKGDAYIDLKIKVVKERIISPIFFTTTNGKFSLPIYKMDKHGFAVIRLFFRLKEQWISIDSGISVIEFYTGEKWHKININTNLKSNKDHATNKRI